MHASQPLRLRPPGTSWGSANGLAWLIFAIAAVLLGAVAWQTYASDAWHRESASLRLAEGVAQDIERNVEQSDLILRTVMSGDQTPASQSLTPEQRNSLLLTRTPRDRYIAFLDVLDASGSVLATLNASEPPTNWANQEYFLAQRGSPTKDLFVGKPFATDHDSNAGLTISRRITANDGKFAGVIVMGVRLAAYRELLGRHEIGRNVSVALLRDDGVILLRLPFDLKDVGHPIEPIGPFHAFVHEAPPPFVARDATDNVERQFVFRRVGTLPLIVSVATPVEVGYIWPLPWWLALGAIVLGAPFALLASRMWREKQMRESAERESGEKSRFLTMLSHELRTPLQGVLGYAEQLSHEVGLSPGQTRQTAEILRAAKHMRDVVNVVLDYARIEALGPTPHMRRVDVRALIEECMAIVTPSAKARGLETRIVVVSGAPVHFITDALQLRQIVMNLLSNAVKYTPSGKVELRLAGNEHHLTIELADTGIGIPEGQRHLLFKEFERFGNERAGIEGTGLGLAISHRLVRRMGGSIGHRDNLGGGSIFWLDLPAGVAHEIEAAADVEETPRERQLNVLIVDDSDVNRQVAAACLRRSQHMTTEAADGNEAVLLAATEDFDVVLMDMRMPGSDGLDATRRIRSLEGSRGQVPIVAMTANALDQHAEACRCAGMTEYLAKPFTEAELLAIVAKAAARRPRDRSSEQPIIDADAVFQLASTMGEEAVQRLFDCLAERIESLLRELEGPVAFVTRDPVAELAHELVGSGGTLGFVRLASTAARFERAVLAGGSDCTEMRREAMAALYELRRRRSLEAMATD